MQPDRRKIRGGPRSTGLYVENEDEQDSEEMGEGTKNFERGLGSFL